VRFRVWAPAARRTVEVELDGARRVPLEAEGDGVWSGTVAEAGPGTRYAFRIDDSGPFPDPYSRSQPDGVHGPSAVVDPNAFVWHDAGWPGLHIQGLVIYQLHVGTATPEGTFEALIGELPRIKALGVNTIEPLPVAAFPGSRNWGYDGVDLFAASHVYGGPDGLKRLIDAAHAVGLGVILDVVYNHLGPDGNYLRQFSPTYFTDRYQTPWGEAINYDGPDSQWVRRLVTDNACQWLGEFHADGLRLDATHAIHDTSEPHILAELSQTARQAAGKPVVLIAETSENDVRYLRTVEQGGYGLDAVWADDFHHTLRRYLAGDHEGYYARYAGTLAEVARCIEHAWLHGTDAAKQPAWQFIYVVQNHDQVGNRALGDRLHHGLDLERYRAASALLLCLPYTPMLFMGQEFAASSPFLYFTDHTPELGKLVTEGRRTEFKAFSAFADPAAREQIPDPQAVATFERSKVHTDEANASPGRELVALYQTLLRLRHEDPVLKDQARERMQAHALDRDTLAVRRWHGAQERLLLVNFGEQPRTVAEFGADWRVLLETGAACRAEASGVTVPPRCAVLLGRGSA
jgi:maltooligosyltrehalose trehalohydrolase